MNTRQTPSQGLDELAAMVVRLGRELAQMAEAASLSGSSHEWWPVSRTLRRLAARDPFDARDDASHDALRGIIAADLGSEVQGTEWEVVVSNCDGDGQQGELRECRCYSARGENLSRLQSTFERFLAARNAKLDRAAADRALLRLMSSRPLEYRRPNRESMCANARLCVQQRKKRKPAET
jgi:hypothetical protein